MLLYDSSKGVNFRASCQLDKPVIVLTKSVPAFFLIENN